MGGPAVLRPRWLVALTAGLAMLIPSAAATAQVTTSQSGGITSTTLQYVTQFYPRWVSKLRS